MNTARRNVTQATRENTAKLVEYLREHGKFPHGQTRAEFRQLRDWIIGEGRSLADGTLGPRIVAFYDEHLPGWSLLGELTGHEHIRFHQRAQECATYFAQHGRYPSKTAKDDHVNGLGAWLHTRRLGAHGNSAKYASNGGRVALLDRLTPGWDTTKSEMWVDRARYLIEFVYAEGRYPGSSQGLLAERAMYHWLRKFEDAVNGNRRGGNPWQVAFMDLHLPGWQARTVPAAGAIPPESLRAIWRAPRQGDVVCSDGMPTLAIRPEHNPTAPVQARAYRATRILFAVPHQILELRSARTVNLAQEARLAADAGQPHPHASVDQYLAAALARNGCGSEGAGKVDCV